MGRREDYIAHWKNSRYFMPFEITPESFFVRMDDRDIFEILRFRDTLEAMVYLRYRGLPDMLDESGSSLFMGIQDTREKLEDRNWFIRSPGLQLLELLDESIERGSAEPEGIEEMKTLFNSASFYAFHYSPYMRYWIRAIGHVDTFLKDRIFREDFEQAVAMGNVPFIELHLLLRDDEFDAEMKHHLQIASDFIDWSSDVFRQMRQDGG